MKGFELHPGLNGLGWSITGVPLHIDGCKEQHKTRHSLEVVEVPKTNQTFQLLVPPGFPPCIPFFCHHNVPNPPRSVLGVLSSSRNSPSVSTQVGHYLDVPFSRPSHSFAISASDDIDRLRTRGHRLCSSVVLPIAPYSKHNMRQASKRSAQLW